MSGAPNLIKVCLCNRGAASETPWAEDLGPAKGVRGGRKVRLVNVPFLHAKPTWGDVIVVAPVDDGLLTWDSNNVAWSKIGTRIEEDGGRYAMIVDYSPDDHGSGDAEFEALHLACAEHDVICEGAWAPVGGKPGRAYLAVPDALDPDEVMAQFATLAIAAELRQIHPKPASPTASRARASGRATPTRSDTASSRTKQRPAAAASRTKQRPAAAAASRTKQRPAAAASRTKQRPAAAAAIRTKQAARRSAR